MFHMYDKKIYKRDVTCYILVPNGYNNLPTFGESRNAMML